MLQKMIQFCAELLFEKQLKGTQLFSSLIYLLLNLFIVLKFD